MKKRFFENLIIFKYKFKWVISMLLKSVYCIPNIFKIIVYYLG